MNQAAGGLVQPELESVFRLVHDRAALRPGFAIGWRGVSRADAGVQRQWAAATTELFRVNAGVACIEAFWRLDPPDPASGFAAADLCRHAGSRAAVACLSAVPVAARLIGASGLATWWQAMGRLAREAPALVGPVAARLPVLLAAGDAGSFADFVAAGLKATVRDRRRRAAFFAGTDPLAQALLARPAGVPGFAENERMLFAFVAGLWGGEPRLQALPPGGFVRTVISSGAILLPDGWPGVAPDRAGALFRAASAHARAHLAQPAPGFAVASLRPVQRVLVGLLEDARVEALAIARFPGLRALWSPWHVVTPAGRGTGPALAPDLLARLARALLDPSYQDPNGFVAKGRALFAAADRADPASSRRIGGLLGNDLGQMRVPFNAATFVVEPGYRDDNAHLWDLPETPDDSVALSVELARERLDPEPVPRARDAGADDRVTVLARYPEWDSAAQTLRADWTTVRDAVPLRGAVTAADVRLRADLDRLVRGVAVGDRRRRPPAETGEELDLDRAIAAVAARRTGAVPDPRLYRSRAPASRDLATLLILDTSQSTAAPAAPGQSILEAQCRAAAALAEALQRSGDRFALRSFASAGRDDVRLTRLKDFDETFGPAVLERLAGLRAGLSTRLGAALRHAGAEIGRVPAARKLVLVLTDGEPSDIDVADPAELAEDASRAVLALRGEGIDVFGVVMGSAATGDGIFGRHNTVVVRRIDEVAARLTGMYFRLAQR